MRVVSLSCLRNFGNRYGLCRIDQHTDCADRKQKLQIDDESMWSQIFMADEDSVQN